MALIMNVMKQVQDSDLSIGAKILVQKGFEKQESGKREFIERFEFG